MTKEQLIKLGLDEAAATKIAEASAEELKGFIPKTRFDEINSAKKQLETDLKDRDKQLTDIKASAGDNDALKKQIEQLQTANKTASEEYQAKIKDMSLTSAVKLALAGKVHDAELVIGLLDKSKIEIKEDGGVKSGLDEQVKALRESKAFLFTAEPKKEGFQFKGVSPAESREKDGDGEKSGDFGKRLAEYAKSNDGLDKARQSYFD